MNIDKLRQLTPGCENVIHFNNAGAALISQGTLNAQIKYLKEEAQFGGYETAAKFHNELDNFYEQAAKLINSEAGEIAFTESATVAWQRAFFSIPFKEGDVILTGASEYASNYISFLVAKEKFGVDIISIPSTQEGEIDTEALEKRIDEKTKLIAITHTPTNGGLVNPAEKIGEVAKKHKVLYLLDACQSAGQYPLDVKKIQCDFLSVTGRKYLRGPRGTGFLYVNKKLLPTLTPTNLDLHGAVWTEFTKYVAHEDARIFETWESGLAGKYAFASALKELNQLDISLIWSRICTLADYFRTKLEEVDGIVVKDIGKIKCGIVTFNSTRKSVDYMQQALKAKNINTSIAIPSGTLLDAKARNLDKMIRASVHYYNTQEEVNNFIDTIRTAN